MNMMMIDKLEKFVSKEPSGWVEKANFNIQNKTWLDRSAEIAIKVLRTLREKGISQAELANRLGISAQQVSKIVKGRENFTLETITKLEMALGISLVIVNCHTSILKIDRQTMPIMVARRVLGTVAKKKETGYRSFREFSFKSVNNALRGA